MIEFRRITTNDLAKVKAFAIEGMRPCLYPLNVSEDKVEATIKALIDDGTHWQLAAFDDEGRMCGGLGAIVQEMPWFERSEAHVILYRCTRPGVGDTLMHRFMEWVRANMAIRRVFWPLEFDAPLGMLRLARSYGFNGNHAVASFYK